MTKFYFELEMIMGLYISFCSGLKANRSGVFAFSAPGDQKQDAKRDFRTLKMQKYES